MLWAFLIDSINRFPAFSVISPAGWPRVPSSCSRSLRRVSPSPFCCWDPVSILGRAAKAGINSRLGLEGKLENLGVKSLDLLSVRILGVLVFSGTAGIGVSAGLGVGTASSTGKFNRLFGTAGKGVKVGTRVVVVVVIGSLKFV